MATAARVDKRVAPAPAAAVHHRTCTLCEAMCGITIRTEGRRVLDVRGDPDDPFSRGHICPKAVALPDLHDDPDRLRKPMVRNGASWKEVSWDEALAHAGRGLVDVQRRHGRHAIASYLGNPTVHNHATLLFTQVLGRALATRSRYSATSLDQLPQMLAGFLMFGHQLLMPVPDVDRTQYLLVIGANPLASNGSLMTVPAFRSRLKALQAQNNCIADVRGLAIETRLMSPSTEWMWKLLKIDGQGSRYRSEPVSFRRPEAA